MSLITINALMACITLAAVMTLTPGPNNTMLLASGIKFGFRRTVPHLLGICIGMPALFFIVGLTLKNLFLRYPLLYSGLEVLGILYLFYLAWRIAISKKIEVAPGKTQPFSFIQAFLFQWINPKVWVMALIAITTIHISTQYFYNLIAISIVFMFISLPCISVWAAGGHALKRFLQHASWIKILNYSMAFLLIISTFPGIKLLFTQFIKLFN